MFEPRKPILVEEAINRVMQYVKTGESESLAIEDCDSRFLANDIVATYDIPMFDRSPYDGFALRAMDTEGATTETPITFQVVKTLGAGKVYEQEVKPFEAVRIMTGAKIPAGCDAVAMFEIVSSDEEHMTIKRQLKAGDNIVFQGEDIQTGEIVVRRGNCITPGIKALLATFGYRNVPVMKKIKVAVFATGDELLDIEEPIIDGKIRNSNTYMLCSQAKRSGADPIYYGHLQDDFEKTYEAVKQALEKTDIVITTGGISVGDFDFLPEVYERLGAEVLFNKVAMRPGSVTTVAVLNGKLLFGLSGNPSACYVGFELFVRPIIRYTLGCEGLHLKKIRAILDSDFPKANPFTRFIRGVIHYDNTRVYVNPSGKDKSNIVSSLATVNCLIILPSGTRGYTKGTEVDILLLEDNEGVPHTWG